MIFLEDSARLLLVIHAVLGAALVGATTHLAWWANGYSRGREDRHGRVRRLSLISVVLFLAAFGFGNLIYPTYKIRVRGELLESGDAIAATHRARAESRRHFWERHYGTPASGVAVARPVERSSQAVESLPRRTARLARWFDVKEHWIGLGLVAALALWAMLMTWDPERDGRAIVPVIRVLATTLAIITWFGAVIGIVTASYQSVGSFG